MMIRMEKLAWEEEPGRRKVKGALVTSQYLAS